MLKNKNYMFTFLFIAIAALVSFVFYFIKKRKVNLKPTTQMGIILKLMDPMWDM